MTNVNTTTGKRLHELFEVGVVLKGLNALLETILGFLFLFIDVRGIVQTLLENELVDDPNDFLASHLQPFTAHLPANAELYSALYLLSHGLVKAVLVIGLLRKKMWAYPASIAVLVLFIAYQVIKFLSTHSIALALLTIFDIALIWLIWKEYERIKQRHQV